MRNALHPELLSLPRAWVALHAERTRAAISGWRMESHSFAAPDKGTLARDELS